MSVRPSTAVRTRSLAESSPDERRYLPLSDEERSTFARDGFVLVRNALTPPELERTRSGVEQVYDDQVASGRARPGASMHLLGGLHRHPALVDLIDHPSTFRFVWGLLGWNVYVHHSHVDVHPGDPHAANPPWNWHQDGYRQNSDIDAAVRPMLSLKVAYVLSDLSETGRGATRTLPGSHERNTLAGRPARPEDPYTDPPGATEIVARAGDAFVFDRRLWHSRSTNRSVLTRRMVFVGYTHRWIRPLDETDYRAEEAWFERLSPLRRQLLGDGPDRANFWGVDQGGWLDEHIPLRRELAMRGLLDESRPYLR